MTARKRGLYWKVEINGLRWTAKWRHSEKPCAECRQPTRGRIEKRPFCAECGMKRVTYLIGGLLG